MPEAAVEGERAAQQQQQRSACGQRAKGRSRHCPRPQLHSKSWLCKKKKLRDSWADHIHPTVLSQLSNCAQRGHRRKARLSSVKNQPSPVECLQLVIRGLQGLSPAVVFQKLFIFFSRMSSYRICKCLSKALAIKSIPGNHTLHLHKACGKCVLQKKMQGFQKCYVLE